MDSLTQIVLGAAVGELVLGKKVGNKAALWGAIGGTIPDLDTVFGFFLDTVPRLEIHRGFSHSIVFALLVSPIFGYLVNRIYKARKESNWWAWTVLFFWTIFTHPLLDLFTTWGTQLFWPLDWRIAIQSIFVIDPLYTLPFLICLVIVLFYRKDHPNRKRWNKLGLFLSSFYLIVTVGIKLYVNTIVEEQLEKKNTSYLRFESRPSPFSTILWTFNIETETSFLISYYSLLDENRELDYKEFSKNDELLIPYRNNPEVERLIQLTKGTYVIEKYEDGVLMHDLRFGLVESFEENSAEFVFSYIIKNTQNGVKIVQKQNSFKDTRKLFSKLIDRILGRVNYR